MHHGFEMFQPVEAEPLPSFVRTSIHDLIKRGQKFKTATRMSDDHWVIDYQDGTLNQQEHVYQDSWVQI